MNRNAHSFASLVAAALCTVVILVGIDRLAVSAPSPALIAHAAITAGA